MTEITIQSNLSCQVAIYNHWLDTDIFMVGRSAPKCHQLSETAREFTILGHAVVGHIKKQTL